MRGSEKGISEQRQPQIGGQRRQPLRVLMQLKKATPEEEQRLSEVIDLLLADWVRRRLHSGEDLCSTTRQS